MAETSQLRTLSQRSSGMIQQCVMLANWQPTVSEVRGIEKNWAMPFSVFSI